MRHAGSFSQVLIEYPLRNSMKSDLTEEEMRRALFGEPEPPAQAFTTTVQETVAEVAVTPPVKAVKKTKVSKGFTPRLRVTLRVGNEFEGKMHEIVHEVDTLSSLVAEQEATKVAKKKFRFVEVVSVKSM